MASQWSTLLAEIQAQVKDAAFQSGGTHEAKLLTMANRFVLEVCKNIDIRRHLKSSTITTTTSDYVYNMPTDFLKPSASMYIHVTGYSEIDIVTRGTINAVDPDHDDTTTSSSGPSYVAVEESQLLTWPMWSGTLQIRDYYRKPTAMTLSTSTLDLVSDDIAGTEAIEDIVVSAVCARVFSLWLQEPGLAEPHYRHVQEWMRTVRTINGRDADSRFIDPAFGV